jgi:hypothetical protein
MNDFQRAYKAAQKDKAWALARRIDAERRMVSCLIKACIARGLQVSINDGEETVVTRSQRYHHILKAMYSTEEDVLSVHLPDEIGACGWFRLIYGNDGYDVIADHSDNPLALEIWDNALKPLSDRLERKLA